MKKIENKFGIKISKNQTFIEFSPLAYNLLKKISNIIKNKNGGLLIIDYGTIEKKMKNTLQAIKNHKKVNLLNQNQEVDITYNLNFELIKKIIKKFDLSLNGYTNQRKFLINLGILNRAEILAKNLDLLATKDTVKIYNDVSISYPTGFLRADKIDYDFETKYFKVSMFDDKTIKMKLIK